MTALTIIVTPIYAACRACLLDHNVIQSGQFANKLIPYPFGEVLACWIFKPGNIVQVVVVEALVEWLECSLDVGEVHNPSRITADRTSDMDCSANSKVNSRNISITESLETCVFASSNSTEGA